MRYLLAPLQSAGLDGILIASGDGLVRRCHPILAVYVGDYPEQCLVSRMYSGDCPVCESPHSSLGDNPSEPYLNRDFEASRKAAKLPHRIGSLKHALRRGSSLYSIPSGKIFQTSTYSNQSHPTSSISCTKVSSNIWWHGSRTLEEHRSSTHALPALHQTMGFGSSTKVSALSRGSAVPSIVKSVASYWVSSST